MINIPESVTTIDSNAFHGCSKLESINIPNGVTIIEYGTFSECSNLTNINIPESVTIIKGMAFNKCTSLTSINIPESVTTIGMGAFWGCKNLTSVNIPESVAEIGDFAFSGCSELESIIIIPNNVPKIGQQAFYNCSKLTSIKIPSSVTEIGNSAFGSCSSLKTIYYDGTKEQWNAITKVYNWNNRCPEDMKIICSNGTIPEEEIEVPEEEFDGYIISQDDLDAGNARLKSITADNKRCMLATGITKINDRSFKECVGLEELIIPNTVTAIGEEAFTGCTNLKSVTIPSSVRSIGKNAFGSSKVIEVPENITDIYGTFDTNEVPSPKMDTVVENYKSGNIVEKYAKDGARTVVVVGNSKDELSLESSGLADGDAHIQAKIAGEMKTIANTDDIIDDTIENLDGVPTEYTVIGIGEDEKEVDLQASKVIKSKYSDVELSNNEHGFKQTEVSENAKVLARFIAGDGVTVTATEGNGIKISSTDGPFEVASDGDDITIGNNTQKFGLTSSDDDFTFEKSDSGDNMIDINLKNIFNKDV